MRFVDNLSRHPTNEPVTISYIERKVSINQTVQSDCSKRQEADNEKKERDQIKLAAGVLQSLSARAKISFCQNSLSLNSHKSLLCSCKKQRFSLK